MFIHQYECEKCYSRFNIHTEAAEGDDKLKCPNCRDGRLQLISYQSDNFLPNQMCDAHAGG